MFEDQGYAVIAKAVNVATQLFPDKVLSFYALGSLARGDFSSVSDVDMAIIMNDSISDEDRKSIAIINEKIKSLEMPFGDRLSIFWSSLLQFGKQTKLERFPALDRLDLLQNAKLVAGPEVRMNLEKPLQQEIEEESAIFISEFLLTSVKQSELFEPKKIIAQGARYLTKFVLFPVRLLFTLDNPGAVVNNKTAADYYLKHFSNSSEEKLVAYAYEWRKREYNEIIPDALPLLQQSLLPLFLQLIDAYHERMVFYKLKDLAKELEKIKSNLTCSR